MTVFGFGFGFAFIDTNFNLLFSESYSAPTPSFRGVFPKDLKAPFDFKHQLCLQGCEKGLKKKPRALGTKEWLIRQ